MLAAPRSNGGNGPAQSPASSSIKLTLDELRGRHGIYDEPTAAQNQSLSWLVRVLQESVRIGHEEVFRHPLVSRKNPTEAQGANWKMQVPMP